MSAVFAAFGVDWRLLIVNSINFAVLLLALWYFLYAPLMRLLAERRQKVSQGVVDAETAEQKLLEIEAAKNGILAEAGTEADQILKNARAAGQEKERAIIAAADTNAARIASEAAKTAAELKAQALEESKQEVAKMVVLGMERAMTK